ncbi:OmpA family protein [Bosea sp. (in: a-proteobacteria)]|uniref:OmpA family protein n=1 Tax=Bosea sp. (in: a-proteobacteria) TaxID=1871050 RepID=UPI002FC7B9E2
MKIADNHHENVELHQNMSRRTLGGLFMALPLLAAVPALAQTDQAATSILRSLAPHDRRPGARRSAPVPRRVRTRSGGVVQEIEIDLSRRVEVTVFFDNDSAALRPGAQQALLRLSVALRDPILADQTFLIAGHTSQDGDYDYNVELSRDRAASVRSWLTGYGGVDGNRLQAHGFGPDMLRNPRNPYSPVNRRVEVIAITG